MTKTICKTIHQYNKYPVPKEDMDRLMAVAEDCRKVKNHVFMRYSGVKSLGKLYPGYTIQNEMTRSGLRQQMSMPSVYFYLAIFDALGDIKSQWTAIKSRVMKLAGSNEHLSSEEKHFIRFSLHVSNVFEALLNRTDVKGLAEEIERQYALLAKNVDEEKMRRYLCRQVRKCKGKLHADAAQGFSITERAYRYGDGGIYISTKEPRKRIFIPLTDHNEYMRQLYIKLYPEEYRIEIKVPVDVKTRKHSDYINTIGIAMGMHTMITTDGGHAYGTELGRLQKKYADWIRIQTGRYNRNRAANPGRVKYRAGKSRHEEQIHSYINMELNRFFQEEKPAVVYMVKLPKTGLRTGSKRGNHYLTMWQRGYIRRRFVQKCRENSVEVVEILGKDISAECSICGCIESQEKGWKERYICPACGYSAAAKVNTARNVKKRGEAGQIVR